MPPFVDLIAPYQHFKAPPSRCSGYTALPADLAGLVAVNKNNRRSKATSDLMKQDISLSRQETISRVNGNMQPSVQFDMKLVGCFGAQETD